MDRTLDWRPGSLWRSPAWRWIRAQILHDGLKRLPEVDDAWVERGKRFLAPLDRLADTKTEGRRPRLNLTIRAAHDLWSAADPERRSQLESYLLTNVPLKDVATRCDLSVAVVRTYHALFFAVRDHPKARDWRLTQAIGTGPFNGFADRSPGALLKYIMHTLVVRWSMSSSAQS
jgi:hypothetical protein